MWVLWQADPEAMIGAQDFIGKVQGRLVGKGRRDPRKGKCIIELATAVGDWS